MSVVLPAHTTVGAMLTDLFARPVKLAPGQALAATAAKAVATYVDGATLRFVAALDMPLFASMGAALALIPAAVVNEAIRTGKPSPALVENGYEVLNILGAAFNNVSEGQFHVKIGQLVQAPFPTPIAQKLNRPPRRADWDVTINGYPPGKLALLELG